MGILDRIAGTLDELTGDTDAGAASEVMRAHALADAGDMDGAEAVLRAVQSQFPRYAPGYAARGELDARRGRLEDAVTALGRAVDLDGGRAESWYGLGDALARLGRTEPARDALRRALTLGLEPSFNARVYAALGRVHAAAGEWTASARALRKALDLTGPGEDDRGVALDYGRALVKLGDREATEWLTRAARAADGRAPVIVEAARATVDHERAEALLRDGLARLPGDRALRAALARRLARVGRTDEAIALAEAFVAEAPEDADGLGALRDSYAADGRWNDALRVAADEARLGTPAPLPVRVTLALGAEDHAALATLATEGSSQENTESQPPSDSLSPVSDLLLTQGERGERVRVRGSDDQDAPLRAALTAFAAGHAGESDLLRLGHLAPSDAARNFLVRGPTPPPPAGQLGGLLTWTYDLFTAAPPLVGLAAAAGHAAEALDRPLLVAVMGEFNAGKSSFVNALAGANVAPTGVTPTTATVNVLRYGAEPAARVVAHDGGTRPLAAADVARFLTGLRPDEARAIRMVEIFLPVETLRRVEIVDTPGLNSILAEHERVTRDFLQEADAIVWVFAIGQAAKGTERAALELAHGAGKRVLGVLNKVDRADDAEIGAVVEHVARSLGDLVETIIPFSATRAAAARAAGKSDAALTALATALDERFFLQARALKRATALSALRRLLAAARAAADAAAPAAHDFAAARDAHARVEQALHGALDSERVALRARMDEVYRRAALEVREFVRPRSWLFGEHRATPADEAFLGELLEDSVETALARTRAALLAAMNGAAPGNDNKAIVAAIDRAIDRFAAYARGVIDGGAVPDFFRHQLPRLRLEIGAIRDALVRRAPDPEQALFAPLRRDLDALFDDLARALADAETDAATRGALQTERLTRPLAALGRAVDELDGNNDGGDRPIERRNDRASTSAR
jgi:tetratricopeptide (TPR) repeat protein/GTP-binding protein EngB required for normal cell division